MTRGAGAAAGGALERVERHLEQVIGADIAAHLEGRLAAHVDAAARRLHLAEPTDVLRALEANDDRGAALLDELLAEVLVHETFFYRFGAQLEALESRVLAPLCARRPPRRIRIWSAGCSRGPEAYTLAMLASRAARSAGDGDLDIRVLGTDLCGAFLDEARRATYGKTRLRELPADLRERCFTPAGDAFAVTDRIRSLVRFERHNLLDPPPERGFDVVACRNVLMYLRPDARRTALEHLARALGPEGVLLAGHSESLRDAADLFAPARGLGLGIYRLATSPPDPLPVFRGERPGVRPARTSPRSAHDGEGPGVRPATLSLEGDYDHVRCPEQLERLKAQLGAALEGEVDVVLDVDGATSLDAATAALVARAARAVAARGRRLVVVATRPSVRRWAQRHRLPVGLGAEEEAP